MKKVLSFGIVLVFAASVLISCKTKVKPLSERIAKVWVARVVNEGSSTVYSSGSPTNAKPGYASYRLNLSSAPNVSLTEVDGNTYTGTYSLQGETTLVLSGLNPQPTGTGGTLTYSITSISDTELVLSLTTAYPKTGNTNNKYTLITN